MDRVQTGRHITTGLALVATLAAGAAPAAAHPHVWVTVEAVVVYQQGSVAAIQHTWTFDEMYTTMAIQGLDTNNDGNYDRKELAELAKVNMEGLKEFAYFTQVSLANQAIATEDPKDYYLAYAEVTTRGESEPDSAAGADKAAKQGATGRSRNTKAKPAPKPKVLSLHFTLPLKEPVLAEALGLSFTVSDPTFFIAFELAKDSPVKLAAGAPPGCRVAIGGAEPDAQDAKPPNEASAPQMGELGFGRGFARPIAVTCSPKP
jgi:ABC-type uncharacterized transport system substrate-binding protein